MLSYTRPLATAGVAAGNILEIGWLDDLLEHAAMESDRASMRVSARSCMLKYAAAW